MKIAVTYQDGDIFQHFGHTEFFKIYDIENTDIVKTEIVSTNGSGHGALAQFLHEHSVDTLICGGMAAALNWHCHKQASSFMEALPARPMMQ